MKATDVYLLKSRNAVDILKTAVNDGYHHVLTRESDMVQSMALQQMYLAVALAVFSISDTVASLEIVVVGSLDGSGCDRVGGYPYQLAAADTWQLFQMVNHTAVLQSY